MVRANPKSSIEEGSVCALQMLGTHGGKILIGAPLFGQVELSADVAATFKPGDSLVGA
jgi:hypothetical protein